MRGRSARLALEHIRDTIALLDDYLTGKSRDDYAREPMLRHAVERCIEIVSEASRRLPDELKARHPEGSMVQGGWNWKHPAARLRPDRRRRHVARGHRRDPLFGGRDRADAGRDPGGAARVRPPRRTLPLCSLYLSSVVSDRGAVRQVVTDQDKAARRHRNQWAGSGSRSSLIRRVGEAHCDNGA